MSSILARAERAKEGATRVEVRSVRRRGLSPLGSVARGILAGLVGTLAMDLVWYRRYRQLGGTSRFVDWEFSSGPQGYENAPAPAQVGKRIVESLFQRRLEAQSPALVNNVVHFATGIGWGTLHGIVAGSVRQRPVRHGLATGAIAWASSYAMLAPAKLYKPMWQYSASTLRKDLSAHLAYGLATSATFWLLSQAGSDARRLAGLSGLGVGRA